MVQFLRQYQASGQGIKPSWDQWTALFNEHFAGKYVGKKGPRPIRSARGFEATVCRYQPVTDLLGIRARSSEFGFKRKRSPSPPLTALDEQMRDFPPPPGYKLLTDMDAEELLAHGYAPRSVV